MSLSPTWNCLEMCVVVTNWVRHVGFRSDWHIQEIVEIHSKRDVQSIFGTILVMAVYAPAQVQEKKLYEAIVSNVFNVMWEGCRDGARDFYLTRSLNVEVGTCTNEKNIEEVYVMYMARVQSWFGGSRSWCGTELWREIGFTHRQLGWISSLGREKVCQDTWKRGGQKIIFSEKKKRKRTGWRQKMNEQKIEFKKKVMEDGENRIDENDLQTKCEGCRF